MTSAALFQTIDTADGPFSVLVDAQRRVLASGWTAELDALRARLRPSAVPAEIVDGETDAGAAARAYYDGDLGAIERVSVHQQGTPLQQRGWAALRRIPAGQVLTYSEFAVELGRASAVRAAASVCAVNAPALFVPCHRVQRSDGTLGGFAWGLDVKRALLAREAGATARPV